MQNPFISFYNNKKSVCQLSPFNDLHKYIIAITPFSIFIFSYKRLYFVHYSYQKSNPKNPHHLYIIIIIAPFHRNS